MRSILKILAGLLLMALLPFCFYLSAIVALGGSNEYYTSQTDRVPGIPLNMDSVGLLSLNFTMTETTLTFAGGNKDHIAAGDTLDLHYHHHTGGQYREIYVEVFGEILIGGTTSIPGGWIADSATYKACPTEACSLAWVDDTLSWEDSCRGHIVIEGSYKGWSTWTKLDSIFFDSTLEVKSRTYTIDYDRLRFITQLEGTSGTSEKGDTIGVTVKIRRLRPEIYPIGPVRIMPDVIGVFHLRQRPALLDTVDTWLESNYDHGTGDVITTAYGAEGGHFYGKLLVMILPDATGHVDSTVGYLVEEQSMDRLNWVKVDSQLAAAQDTPVYDTVSLHRMPFLRFRSQYDATDTDSITGFYLRVLAQRLK